MLGGVVLSRRVLLAWVLLITFILSLAAVGEAEALPAVWTGQTPAPASAVAESQPIISVRVYADRGIQTMSNSFYLKVDGLYLRKPTLVFDRSVAGDIDLTRATLSAPTHFVLTEGSHKVDSSVLDYGGVRHKTSWTFGVVVPPVFSNPAPAPGSTVTVTAPVITVSVSDGDGIASVSATIDGNDASAFLVNGSVQIAPLAAELLADEVTHTVWVRATDTKGASADTSWSFVVQTSPRMVAQTDCLDCHTAYPSAHPVDDCVVCHGEGSPVGGGYTDPADAHAPGTSCSNCHGNLTDCTRCHGQAFATVPPLHDFTEDDYHIAQIPTCSGLDCHYARLTTEHNRYSLDCMTCHASTDPDVSGAITAGNVDCGACHPGAGSHTAVHDSALDAACAACHDANLVTQHVTDGGLDCGTCHASADEAVIGAIESGEKSCGACHPGAGSHTAVHDSALDAACAACHDANLVTQHVTDGGLDCGTCHASADEAVIGAIESGEKSCGACHPGSGDHRALHESTIGGCADCHDGNLVAEHIDGQGLACDTCHTSTDPAVIDAIAAGDKRCGTCHDMASHPYPEASHQAAVAAVPIAGTITNPFGAALHYYDGTLATSGGQPCGQCHLMDLLAEHTKPSSSVAAAACAACHSQPRDTFTDWSGACQQGGCHAAAYHDQMGTKHYQAISGTRGVRADELPLPSVVASGCGRHPCRGSILPVLLLER